MTLDNDVKQFKLWAMQLGCSPESIPCDKTLIKLFSCGQSLAFQNLLNKIKPRNEIRQIRQNILVNLMQGHKGSLISLTAKTTLPKELQTVLKAKQLKNKIYETEKRIEDTRKDCDKFEKILKEKNSQIHQSKSKLKSGQIRHSIFYSKNKNRQKSIADESIIEDKIKQIIPAPFNPNISYENKAAEALKKSIEDLTNFYKIENEPNDAQNRDKKIFWNHMNDIFNGISNISLWNDINRWMEQHFQTITTDTVKLNIPEIKLDTSRSNTEFSTAIHKMYARNVGLKIDITTLNQETIELKEVYFPLYCAFLNSIETKMNLYNNTVIQHLDSNLLTDFSIKFSMVTFSTAEIEFLKDELAKKEQMVKAGSIDDFQLVIATVKQTYDDIEKLFVKIQNDFELIALIKTRIMQSIKNTKYLIQELNVRYLENEPNGRTLNFTESLLNSPTINSFTLLSGSQVLSSTKLDVSHTLRGRENQPTKYSLPQFVNDISLLMNVPVMQMDEISAENQLVLKNNAICMNSQASSVTPSMGHYIFGYYPMAKAIINDVEMSVAFHQKLNNLPALISSLHLPDVDQTAFKQNHHLQNNKMEELMDEIVALISTTNHTIDDAKKYYKFLLDNPLGQYVPKTKLFNGRTFEEYEQEYLIHYTILKNNSVRN